MVDAQADPDVPTADAPAVDAPVADAPDVDAPAPQFETPEKFDVIYSCLRCATDVSAVELERLPEIKCICGFRVFVKNRPPVVKSVRAV